MKFNSWLIDKKIFGVNVSIETNIDDYSTLADKIIAKNILQRKKVNVKGKPYVLLKRDLLDGCLIPPIVLAVEENNNLEIRTIINEVIATSNIGDHRLKLEEYIQRAYDSGNLIILDGMQRTFTIKECLREAKDMSLETFKKQVIRAEIYLGLSKTGILYRMLTLNTGQTPMSFRHQIEILYHDYLDKDNLGGQITVVKEVDDSRARGSAKYKYADVVDMFYAFTTGMPSSLDKQALVNQLSELNFIEEYKPDGSDLNDLLVSYNKFVRNLEGLAEEWTVNADFCEEEKIERPFGKNIASVFERVQPMTAFGAECKRLIKLNEISSINELSNKIDEIQFITQDSESALNQLIMVLDKIAKTATRIGPAQREFFQYSFRALLTSSSDTYLDLGACWLAGESRYVSMNSTDF